MLEAWLGEFISRVQDAFGDRVKFIGLQGSYGRGEATAQSDIDVVVILDAFSYSDLKRYDEAIAFLPRREKICGFISGEQELACWDRADLFQFYHDTRPLWGSLDWLAPLLQRQSIVRAVRIGACNLYHGCVHNALHEKSSDVLKGLLKSAVFVLQAKCTLEKGKYPKTRAELNNCLTGQDLSVLRAAMAGDASARLEEYSRLLMEWSGEIIRDFEEDG